MTARQIAGGIRNRALRLIDRSDRSSQFVIGRAVAVARRLGADPVLLAEAERPGRPLTRALQIVLWSSALAGRGSFPSHFAPGDHLGSVEARARAVEALQALDPPPPNLDLQLIGLDDALAVADVTERVRADLVGRLHDAATRPKRGAGLDSDLQRSAIAEVSAALCEVGVRPFLMSGTLLGFVRDGDVMPYDHDVDLGLLPDDDTDAALDALHGLESFEVAVVGPRIEAQHDSGVTVDVFPHELRDGLWWHATKIHEWWNTPFELVSADLQGTPVWVPDEPERYLTENYGRWSHPVPFYDISFDTPNRRYRDNLDAVRFLHSRCVQALRDGDRWLLESAARELRDQFGVDVTELLAESRLLDS